MGAFFTNIQVSRSKPGQIVDRNDLAKCITSVLREQGIQEVPVQVEGSRRIYIGGDSKDEWLTVLDSATEGQDPVLLDRTAARISEFALTAAISILVHDGDRLHLSLFKEGSKLASLDSWIGYFEGETPSTSTIGIEVWSEVLPAGKSIEDLLDAWSLQRSNEGALPRLQRIAQVLGIDADRCAIGANSLSPTMQSKFTKLIFFGNSPITDRVGLPALGYAGVENVTQVNVGGSRSLSLIAHSIAGPGSGIRVIVWGSALNASLVSVSGPLLMIGEGNPARALNLESQSGSDELILTALVEDIDLPAGYGSPGEAFAAAYGDIIKGMSIWLATRINVSLDLVGVKPGTGILSISLQPLTNHDGQAIWATNIQVDPKA